ncbi:MAG: hypothetical protein AAF667_12525 [Pseudomonadota bacterium]
MRQNSLFALIGCAVFACAGIAMMASNFYVVRDGFHLLSSEQKVDATVVGKDIERPTRKAGVRGESISINGSKARSLRTYFNAYFAVVSEQTGSSTQERRASVTYEAWHSLDIGTVLEITVAPNVPDFADISPGGTLRYGLKQMAIGFAILLLGVGVLFLPSEEEDENPRYT